MSRAAGNVRDGVSRAQRARGRLRGAQGDPPRARRGRALHRHPRGSACLLPLLSYSTRTLHTSIPSTVEYISTQAVLVTCTVYCTCTYTCTCTLYSKFTLWLWAHVLFMLIIGPGPLSASRAITRTLWIAFTKSPGASRDFEHVFETTLWRSSAMFKLCSLVYAFLCLSARVRLQMQRR